jgi:FMN phosphatase YigB (HAD superfamily)
MLQCIIFDLSEVLIAGLVGIEKQLSHDLLVPEDEILPCFAGNWREALFVGNISEDAYLRQVIARGNWDISTARLKRVIRDNFHTEVEGALSILNALTPQYELVLLSDHAREWVAYIRTVHSFLKIFQRTFFSYDLRRTKKDPQAFLMLLDAVSVSPYDCLFIDDNPGNVSVAGSVGIPGIHFVGAAQLAVELERRQVRCAI